MQCLDSSGGSVAYVQSVDEVRKRCIVFGFIELLFVRCLNEPEPVFFHKVGFRAGGCRENVGCKRVGVKMETFNAFGGTIDVEVLVVDNADFVIVAKIGVGTLLGEQIKAECRVFPLYR